MDDQQYTDWKNPPTFTPTPPAPFFFSIRQCPPHPISCCILKATQVLKKRLQLCKPLTWLKLQVREMVWLHEDQQKYNECSGSIFPCYKLKRYKMIKNLLLIDNLLVWSSGLPRVFVKSKPLDVLQICHGQVTQLWNQDLIGLFLKKEHQHMPSQFVLTRCQIWKCKQYDTAFEPTLPQTIRRTPITKRKARTKKIMYNSWLQDMRTNCNNNDATQWYDTMY